MPNPDTCFIVEGGVRCGDSVIARARCPAHYRALRKFEMKKKKRICSVEGCERVVNARGWCSKHYARWSVSGSTKARVRENKSRRGQQCGIESCERPAYSRGLCHVHYNRDRRWGYPLGGLWPCELEECSGKARYPNRFCTRHQGLYEEFGDPRYKRGQHYHECELPWCEKMTTNEHYCKDHKRVERTFGSAFAQKVRIVKKPYPECKHEGCSNILQARYGRRYCYRHFREHGDGKPCAVEGCKYVIWSRAKGLYCRKHRDRDLGRIEEKRPKQLPRERRPYARELLKESCWYCSQKATTIDHITPQSKGGTHDEDNLAAACLSCNSKKHNKSLLMFLLEEDCESVHIITTSEGVS